MKKLSRREFLRLSALTTAGLIAAGCAPKEEAAAPTATPKPAEPTATPEPVKAQEVKLEIFASNPEYENAEAQVWDIYVAENPHVSIEMFSSNEDTAAAIQARIAGGWTPALGPSWAFGGISPDTYENFLDLSTINFSWWDRFTHDPLNKVPELYGYGPRCININAGFVFTWEFHKDLMEASGLNPRSDVKTWDDLLGFLEAGAEWAAGTDEVDFFWDQAWHSWVVGSNYMRTIPLAFADGQQPEQLACWQGEKKFNDASSPFRHTLEFFKLATDEGWVPENWWTREWETDMEASYIAKKSVMMLHGPWPWDKMLAADPTAEQEGLPSTPPAEGQTVWVQYQSEPRYSSGQASILKAAADKPEFPEIEKAFDWYHTPANVKARLEILGQPGLYRLDEPLDLSGPQWAGCVCDIAVEGGLFEDVQYTQELWGEQWIDPKLKGGAPGTWDWNSGAMVEPFSDVMKGDMSVQEFLDWAQKNWEESYEL